MPFHFVTVEGEGGRHGSIYEASDRDALKESVTRQCGDDSYRASFCLDEEYAPFLSHAVHGKDEEAVVRIQKGVFDILRQNLRKQGSHFADAVAMALLPFKQPECFMPDKLRPDIPKERARCFKDDARLLIPPSALYRHCVHALEEGAANRVAELEGYRYYFVSGRHRSGAIVDLIVHADTRKCLSKALRSEKMSPRPLVLRRLAPFVQEACLVANALRHSSEQAHSSPDSETQDVTSYTREGFRRWISRLHDEGRRIHATHADVHAADFSQDTSASPDARAGVSDAWEKIGRCTQANGLISLNQVEMRQVMLDVLSHGCRRSD